MALFLLWPVLKPFIKVVCKCVRIPFKCLKSVGRHRKTIRQAKKLRKKEAKKLAKEQRRMKQKAHEITVEARQARRWDSCSDEPEEPLSSATEGSESGVSSEVTSSAGCITDSRRQRSNQECAENNNCNTASDNASNAQCSTGGSKTSRE